MVDTYIKRDVLSVGLFVASFALWRLKACFLTVSCNGLNIDKPFWTKLLVTPICRSYSDVHNVSDIVLCTQKNLNVVKIFMKFS